jgi:hypothetical protein
VPPGIRDSSIQTITPPVQRKPVAAFPPIHPQKGNHTMLMTIAIILLVLWALGLVTSYTMGGLIHILVVVAVVIVLVRLIQGRRVI